MANLSHLLPNESRCLYLKQVSFFRVHILELLQQGQVLIEVSSQVEIISALLLIVTRLICLQGIVLIIGHTGHFNAPEAVWISCFNLKSFMGVSVCVPSKRVDRERLHDISYQYMHTIVLPLHRLGRLDDLKFVGNDLAISLRYGLYHVSVSVNQIDSNNGIDANDDIALSSKHEVLNVIDSSIKANLLLAPQLNIELIIVQCSLLWTVALNFTVCLVCHQRCTNIDFELRSAFSHSIKSVPSDCRRVLQWLIRDLLEYLGGLHVAH